MKPQIEAAILAANSAAASVEVVITRAGQDHDRAEQDHTTASGDHTTATTDHTTAQSDHTTATGDHGIATTDHRQAVDDDNRAEGDHTTAQGDHNVATADHNTASGDHLVADSDHIQAGEDHTTATGDHDASVQATAAAGREALRAKGYNDNPWDIGEDGYIYVWDETTQAMVRTNKMIIDFNDLTPEQQAAMVQEFISQLTFDETPTSGSTNPVTSRGIKAALDQKQDTLSFADDALCSQAAAEVVFTVSG